MLSHGSVCVCLCTTQQRKFEAKYDIVGRLVEAGTEAAATPAPEVEDDEPAAAPQK